MTIISWMSSHALYHDQRIFQPWLVNGDEPNPHLKPIAIKRCVSHEKPMTKGVIEEMKFRRASDLDLSTYFLFQYDIDNYN